MNRIISLHVIMVTVMFATLVHGDVTKPKVKIRDISGLYECKGTNADGSIYKGQVTIRRAGAAYVITWSLARQKHSGIGLYESGVFSSTWTYNNDRRHSGITTYKCLPNGQLKGKWISAGGGPVNTETLTPIRKKQRKVEGDATKSVLRLK